MRRACAGHVFLYDPWEWDICIFDSCCIDEARLPNEKRKLACWYGLDVCELTRHMLMIVVHCSRHAVYLSGPDCTCVVLHMFVGVLRVGKVLCQFFYYEFVSR